MTILGILTVTFGVLAADFIKMVVKIVLGTTMLVIKEIAEFKK
jgi:hypothetical protein